MQENLDDANKFVRAEIILRRQEIMTDKPKETSYEYGESYQQAMLNYYNKSKEVSELNTEYLRVVLAHQLVKNHVSPRLEKKTSETTVVDIGCSVGLFAINFSLQGYKTIGIDFDKAALEIAETLNVKEGARAKFINSDVASLDLNEPIDIALCFDIFEHLHDDELGALLLAIKQKMSKGKGYVVFHTLPMQYDYIFWSNEKGVIQFPWFLRPFRKMPSDKFARIVKLYALVNDFMLVRKAGVTYKEMIKKADHPNPLTRERLVDIFARMGYEMIHIETGFLGNVQLDSRDTEYFYKHEITHRSLRGVATPKRAFP